MPVHELTRAQARRVAVRAQALDANRPTDLHDLVRRLTMLQCDPASVVAPSADLVAWSRLGDAYRTSDLVDAVAEFSLIELRGMIRPAEDIVLYSADMKAWPGRGDIPGWLQAQSDWVDANEPFHQDVLEWIGREGPTTSRGIPDTSTVAWRSSGWNNNRNVAMMIDFAEQRGEVASVGRQGRERLWDLAVRVHPGDRPVPAAKAARIRDERRLAALGIARARGPECPIEPNDVGEAGAAAVVEGVKGQWRVDPALLEGGFEGRVALLSPIDRLVYDRRRMVEIFEFDYQLEMFKPVAKRRWGYWALPILVGDRLVGKVDATANRKDGVLYVEAVHEDEPFDRRTAAAVDREISALARWLQLDLARPAA